MRSPQLKQSIALSILLLESEVRRLEQKYAKVSSQIFDKLSHRQTELLKGKFPHELDDVVTINVITKDKYIQEKWIQTVIEYKQAEGIKCAIKFLKSGS